MSFVGRVGKLSIKIPWKKLGWDPIIIDLEDVFVCASQRDAQEVLSISLRKKKALFDNKEKNIEALTIWA